MSARSASRGAPSLQHITASSPQDAADARHGIRFPRVPWNQGGAPRMPRRIIPMHPVAPQSWDAIGSTTP
ncbi:hypothetical protein NDU88_001471 [Pleurodeles waltl]|uniref:Uncharacterized protein n=1 Tax=Pleurodeles waltl TaxID=8319 RepID=A0AAV7LB27_PLEWA|nr:hypothetical protein NDU88_001471 [Pleurodeles waltl]